MAPMLSRSFAAGAALRAAEPDLAGLVDLTRDATPIAAAGRGRRPAAPTTRYAATARPVVTIGFPVRRPAPASALTDTSRSTRRGGTPSRGAGMCFSDEPGLYLPGRFGVGQRWFGEPPTSLDTPV